MSDTAAPHRLLARKRRHAALVLWLERLLPALAPSLWLLLSLCAVALLGLGALLPPLAALALLASCLMLALGLAAHRLRRLTPPSRAMQDRRLERADPARPLTTLADRPALPGAAPVWQAHRARALARIAALHPGPPRLPKRATGALAGFAALIVLGALLPGGASRLAAAFLPAPRFPPPPSVQIQAWIVAPPRFGLAPLFLPANGTAPITVPPGSRLGIAVQGGRNRPVLVADAQRHRFRRLGATTFQAEAEPRATGPVQIWRAGHLLSQWQLALAPAAPPTIALTGPPARQDTHLVLPWRATDRYGLTAVATEIRLRDRPGAAPLVLPHELPDRPRAATGNALPDLTANPWAGLPVYLRAVAHDSAGLRGASASVEAVLPARAFLNPTARALAAIRQHLALDPGDTDIAVKALDDLSLATMNALSAGEWLDLRAISALLHERPDDTDQIAARLWTLALTIEDAGIQDAKQRLADATAAVAAALAAPPGPDRAQRLAQANAALDQALRQYLHALDQQAARNGTAPPRAAGGRSIDAKQLAQMEQDMAAAAAAGHTEQAQRLLQQLASILDHLRLGAPPAGAAKPNPDQQALQKLTQDQAALRDHSEQRLSDSADPRTDNLPERDPDEAATAPDPTTQRHQDTAAQAGLRQRLGQLAQTLGDRGDPVPQGLARADGAMRDAHQALTQGNDAAARAAQQRALEGLQGAGQEMAQASGAGSGQGQSPEPGTDPLGRKPEGQQAGNGTAQDDADTTLPGAADGATGRALRDELRRRSADRTRPPAELDYIQKLLNDAQ